MRTFFATVCALLICTIAVLAGEIKGKIKSADADKKCITVVADDGKETEVIITDDTKILSGKGTPTKDREKSLKGLMNKKGGAMVTATTEKKDGKEVATEIKVSFPKKEDKKDK